MRDRHFDEQLPTGAQHIPYLDYMEMARKYLLHGAEVAAGSVAGTGGALDVACPFDPGAVILFNRTAPCLAMKLPGMAAAACMKLAGTPALSYLAANGITLGGLGDKKFTIGTDADINTAAEQIEWIAFGFRVVNGVSL